MTRPVKPQFTTPTLGQGFGRAASQVLLDLPGAMQFLDDSNAYQMSLFDAPNDAIIVQGDKAAQGISAATARRPLFVNADGSGLTTELPAQTGNENFFAYSKVFTTTGLDFERITRSANIFNSGGNTILVANRNKTAGFTNSGHTLGHRFLELEGITALVGSPGSISNNVLPIGANYPVPARDDTTTPLTELETNLSFVIRLPQISGIEFSGASADSVNRATPMFDNPIGIEVNLGHNRSVFFEPNNGVWEVSCEAIDSPKRRVTEIRSLRSGIYFVSISSALSTSVGSSMTIAMGAFGVDDYLSAFGLSGGYASTDPSHPAYIGGARHASGMAVVGIEPQSVEFRNGQYADLDNQFQITYLYRCLRGVRIFDVQLQIGNATGLINAATK